MSKMSFQDYLFWTSPDGERERRRIRRRAQRPGKRGPSYSTNKHVERYWRDKQASDE